MIQLPLKLFTVLFLFALFQSSDVAAQKMVKKQRVTTIWNRYYYKDSLDMSDSMLFYYSGTRGSRFNPFSYSPLGLFERDYGYNIQFTSESQTLPEISAVFTERGPISAGFDSVYEYTRYSNKQLKLEERTYAAYNSSGYLILWQQKEIYNERYTISRDANDLPLSIKYEHFDSSRNSWQQKILRNVWHSSEKLPLTDTTYYEWPPRPNYTDLASSYTFDNDGRLIAEKRWQRDFNDWRGYDEYLYTYDDQGRISKRKYIEDSHVDEVIHLFYDNNGRISRVVNTPIDDINFQPIETTLTYDTDGNTIGMDQVDPLAVSGITKYETRFYYNSYKNPDSAITKTYGLDGKPLPRHYRTYYSYEIYDGPDTTGAKSGAVVIYANPARSKFNIRWNDRRPSQPVYVNLYSSSGQRVLRRYISKAAATDAIQLGGLESGLYHLRIVTEAGEELHVGKLVVQQ